MNNKFLLLTVIWGLLLIFGLQAQDTTKVFPQVQKNRVESDSLKKENSQKKTGQDKSQNKTKVQNSKNKKSEKDVFVDKDGDGINDGEESGIGLRKMYRHRKHQQNSPHKRRHQKGK